MSHNTEEYWESLGPQGHLLQELFHNQTELITQLHMLNKILEDQAMEAKDDVSDAATKAASAQAILMNMLAGSHS